jgi:Cu+-exporting ATPase
MPAYRDHLTAADVDALVAHLHSLGAPAGASGAVSTPEAAESDVEDPVCGMRMKPARAAARADDHGKSFYFCSERCRTQFMEEPGRYVRP